jgi:hypothetical protein
MLPILLTTCVSLVSQAAGGNEVLWQIGKPDRKYAEFAIAGKHGEYVGAFPGDVTFHVGRDDPAKAWSYIQPGPGDVWAGSKPHTFRILFDLAKPVRHPMRLIIDLVNTNSSNPPCIRIGVNGHNIQIQTQRGGSDDSLTRPAAGHPHVLCVPFVGQLLKAGTNTIEITTVQGSWMLYDALRLEKIEEKNMSSAMRAEFLPFLRKSSAGPCQILNVQIDAPGPAGRLELMAADRKTAQPVPAAQIGGRSVGMAIPPVDAPCKGELVLKSGDQTLRQTIEMKPPRPWKIFLVQHTHSDVGYPDDQAAIAQAQTDFIDAALDCVAATRDYPDDAKFRWACEATWGVDLFLALRGPQRIQALKDAVAAGRVEITAMPMNMTDLATEEVLIHSLQDIARLRRVLGAKIVAATQNDVNGFPLSLPRLLASCGVKYLATGINQTRSIKPFDRPTGLYWEAPDGTPLLTWRGEHYMAGDPLARQTDPGQAEHWLANYLAGLEKAGYPHNVVLLQTGGYGTDDAWPSPTMCDVVKAWNERCEWPKLRVGTFTEFFEALEAEGAAEKLPHIRKAWCDWWADGNGSAVQEVSLIRQAHEELDASLPLLAASMPAQSFGQLISKINHSMLRALMFDEHTWGYAGSIDRPNCWMTKAQWGYKAAQAREAGFLSAQIYDAARAVRVENIATDAPALVIENPSSWARGGVNVFRIPAPATFGRSAFKLVDAVTGKPVAAEKLGGAPIFDEMHAIDVPSVPALGYRVLRIDPSAAAAETTTDLKRSGNAIENDFYRVEVDPKTGVVASWKDKKANRELAGKDKYGLVQYVYEQIRDPRGRGMIASRQPSRKFDRAVPAVTAITGGYDGVLAKSLHVRSKIDDAHTVDCELILYRRTPRIDVKLTVNKPAITSPEAGYLSLPFSLNKPIFDIDAVGGTFRPGPGQIDRSASDYHSIQRYVRISEDVPGGLDVIVASRATPLAQIGDIHTGQYQETLTPPGPVFYMWLFNNYWFTNFLASQGGEMIFEFSLSSYPKPEQPVTSAHRSAVNYCMPLPLVYLPAGRTGSLQATQGGIMDIAPVNVMMTGLKWARQGDSVVMRLREFDGKATKATIRFAAPWKVNSASKVNVLEEPIGEVAVKDGAIELEFRPFEMIGLGFKTFAK